MTASLTAGMLLCLIAASTAASSPGEIAGPRWLPPLEQTSDTDPDPGSTVSGGQIMPVFDTHHFFHPYLTPRFNLSERRHMTLYEEVLMTGSRRFVTVHRDKRGRLLDVGNLFFITQVASNKAKSYYFGEHVVTGRVKLKRILNPSEYSSPVNYIMAQVEFPYLDIDAPKPDEADIGEEIRRLLSEITTTQEKLNDMPRLTHEHMELIDFGRGTQGLWEPFTDASGQVHVNSSWGLEQMGLWGPISLWQRLLDERCQEMWAAMTQEAQELVHAFFASKPTDSRGHAIAPPEGQDWDVKKLPEPIRTEVALRYQRYHEDATPFDPTGPDMQLMLQTQSHRQRLEHFRGMMQAEHGRLSARLALHSLSKGTDCADENDAPETRRRLELSAAEEPLHPSLLGDMLLTRADGQAGGSAAWLSTWHRRLGCWWVALPFPTQQRLGVCMGALGLHVGSRLDTSWRAAQGLLGRATAAAPPEPAMPAGCEWIGEEGALVLPEFPPFPSSESSFVLPPLPRLLPSWQKLNLLSLGGVDPSRLEERTSSPAGLAEQVSVKEASSSSNSGVLTSAGAGFGAGAGAALAIFAVLGRRRNRNGTGRLRSAPSQAATVQSK